MRNRLKRAIRLLLILALLSLPARGQSEPRRTDCLQWDQSYAQMVLLGMVGATIGAAALGLLIGFIAGRHFWLFTLPRTRIWIAGAIVAGLTEFFIVIWPHFLPLGRLFFASIDPRYRECRTMSFGAPGLLRGLIGEGVAAYAQWQAVTMLLIGAAAAGALIAWIFSEAIVRSGGLEAAARGGEA
jgi:hypothetical protein